MIEIIEGLGVGAGKSYYVATRLLKHFAAGGTAFVSSSFGLNFDECQKLVADRWGKVIEPDQYRSFEREETWRLHEITPQGTEDCPLLIVLDECHQELNARDWADTKKRPFFNWLTQSRHDDCDLIFISQSSANIDKQIARLVTYVVRMRNMANFVIPGLGRWPLKQFLMGRFDHDGRNPQGRQWLWHDRAVFKCYNSKVMRGAHRRLGGEIPRKTLKTINRSKRTMKYILFAMICAGVWCGVNFYNRLNAEEEGRQKRLDQRKVAAPVVQAAPVPAVQVAKVEREPAYSVVTEEFRGTDEKTYLRTAEAEYFAGQMSPKGFVSVINAKSAQILTPERKVLWIVAQVRPQKPVAAIEGKEDQIKPPQEVPSIQNLTKVQRIMGGYPSE